MKSTGHSLLSERLLLNFKAADDTDGTSLIPQPHPGQAGMKGLLRAMIDTAKVRFLGEVNLLTALLAHRMDYQLVLIST